VNNLIKIDSVTMVGVAPNNHIINLDLKKWYLIQIVKNDLSKEIFIETGDRKEKTPLRFIPDFSSSQSILVSWDPDIKKYKYLFADIEP
jgi:hypothetical protein